jgi:hypothetical protein
MITFRALQRIASVSVPLLAILAFVAGSAHAAPATERPWWHLSTADQPTNLPPGGEGTIAVTAFNLGDAPARGESSPITITDDHLPAGLTVTSVKLYAGAGATRGRESCETTLPVSCTWSEAIYPYEALELRIRVKVEGASSGERNEASASGGGAGSVTASGPIAVGAEPAPFGVESNELAIEGEAGRPETQAAAHPFQVTSTIALNQKIQPEEGGACTETFLHPCLAPSELPKDLSVKLPVGLVGNAQAVPQCSEEQFAVKGIAATNDCAADTAVGVANITLNVTPLGLVTLPSPIFNLVPSPGEPARFGFVIEGSLVTLDTSVRTGEDYGIVVSSNDISELPNIVKAETTFWGVPGDPRHDDARGWSCLQNELKVEETIGSEGAIPPCKPQEEQNPPAFLTLPSACTGPLQTSLEAVSWTKPEAGLVYTPSTPMESLDGCNKVPFSAGIEVAPDLQQASTATGLTVDVHVPQQASVNSNGIAAGSDVKTIKVTLPEGVTLNPSGANGLEACSEGEIGYRPAVSTSEDKYFTATMPSPFCPDASKVGKVKITTPLLGHPLEGAVYLATQNENPFGSLVAIYIVAEDPISGVLVKLPGEISLDEHTGRITTTFADNPELPFEDALLEFYGGERAPLSTPTHCGTYTTEATFTPWSGNAPVTSTSSFNITSGPNGTACPGPALPFSPSLTGGMTNINAGAFSPLTATIGREDGQQNINQVQLKMPPGLSGILSGVPLCGEAQANAGTCGEASKIGSTIVSVGLGGDPYSVTGGRVYLTGPYQGAPFGLSIVNPAVAGPFNLGNVVVRAKIEVNPTTAALTVTTNSEAEGYAIPHILQGIPLQIKHINVTIERPGFTFNPTNCTPASITGSVGSFEGASSAVSVPFQVTNCATLKFAPKFAVSTPGHTSKADGAGLTAKLSYPVAAQGTQADIKAVKVDLPKQLPSRLTTLQKACTSKQFETNPANCPKASKIGFAKVSTPLLPVPLEGPAIFVSHGGEAFPTLTMVLQGYGVTVDLVGTTYISHAGITSTTFKTVPDVPFNTFELTLGQGPYSALAANLPNKDHGDFCGQSLAMPTAFVAQNGLEIHESTKLSVSGCPKAKKAGKSKKKKGKGTKKK